MSFPDPMLERLPSGRHQLTRDMVINSQRLRLLLAVIAVVGDRGWASTRIADVVERAGVSRATFYEHFANLDACLAEAFDVGVIQMLKPMDVEAGSSHDADLATRLHAFFSAYVQTLRDVDGLPRTLHVEMVRASDRLLDTRRTLFEMMARRMERAYAAGRRHDPTLPERTGEIFDFLVGALDELYRERIRTLGPEEGLDGIADTSTSLSLEALGVDEG